MGQVVRQWVASIGIDAPADRVFRTVADPDEFQRATGGVVPVQYLSETRAGVGTRFAATRMMKGKPSVFEEEVTEYVANERIRMRNAGHGTVWDSVFIVTPASNGTELRLAMDAIADGFMAKFMLGMMKGMVQGALDTDLAAIKAYCEDGRTP